MFNRKHFYNKITEFFKVLLQCKKFLAILVINYLSSLIKLQSI